jgi:glycosyltransferase involved in cell wall biosynthesis
MAAGLPVVASRIGQLRKLIQPGQNGLLVTPGDATELAEALEELKLNPSLRAALGRTARDTVIRQYTWDAVAEKIFALAGVVPAAAALNHAGA